MHDVMWYDWLIGLLGSGLIGGLAFRKKSLSGSGAVAAMVVGTVLYALGNLAWFGTLIAFFLSSTLLSKWKKRAKAELEAVYEKGDRRDAGQVLANGGIGALLCVAHTFVPDSMVTQEVWWLLFVGVMATVNADTWATEIGGLSKGEPRSILTGKRVPRGTSGGVSVLGTTATMAGGLFIGAVAWGLSSWLGASEMARPLMIDGQSPYIPFAYSPWLLMLGWVGGTLGSLTDSLLGARLQVMYRCSACGRELEQKVHCDVSARRVRGLGFLNNDAVNLSASLAGGVAAWLLALLLR
ncbi:MAG TPA: DUF92 domain-containing protein [Bacilli bacterium]|nr:DUF92 domain-containing protein [Bacilli bacterium]